MGIAAAPAVPRIVGAETQDRTKFYYRANEYIEDSHYCGHRAAFECGRRVFFVDVEAERLSGNIRSWTISRTDELKRTVRTGSAAYGIGRVRDRAAGI